MGYVLSAPAEEDYLGIYMEGLLQFGPRQADAYIARLDHIGDNPRLGPVRPEISGAPRIHATGSHIIFWEIEPDGTAFILRIRHHREDWFTD
ncbi:type II toxin-antitoxin system RelE/ParE family toxin [Paracoccus sp. (in: a-proteobacteria)]|uniref:type II toxin-antitoxin system RelE/ParE family toxin n=1 Tax=Paracoccus sp. TaxID=267 RepID=UPI0026E0CA79|nr:type II toxin-antitoxin system RelE/ParE family toxin [Paracoccus sp. (in: a-proteobacteria)]MDO5370859.1 type II toxin-antitoxin system RelE/ParE family toxin [Paracoccus sp. (in: a-proteobacteria)]